MDKLKKYFIQLVMLDEIIEYFIKKRFKILRKIAKRRKEEPKK